jgi:hypothetical protein
MDERVHRFHDRCWETWAVFKNYGERYWLFWLFLGYVGTLISDWAVGWAKGYISGWSFRVLEHTLLSPLLLPALVLSGLLILAFVQSGKPPKSESDKEWIQDALFADSEGLWGKLHIEGPSQEGHITFDLDHKSEPSIIFTLRYINASIYTVLFKEIGGILQMEGGKATGFFSMSPFEARRGYPFSLSFKFVLNTDASVRSVRELVDLKTEQKGYISFNLDAMKIKIAGEQSPYKHDHSLPITNQYWRAPR